MGLLTPIQHESHIQEDLRNTQCHKVHIILGRSKEDKEAGNHLSVINFLEQMGHVYRRDILFYETQNKYFLISSN